MRYVVTNKRRLSLAGWKPRISPAVQSDFVMINKWCWYSVSLVKSETYRCIGIPGQMRWPTWWRHQMVTLLAICAGNSPVTGEFPSQSPVTRSFDVFFDLRLNNWMSKQWWGWWFETPSRPLWRHFNETWWWLQDRLSMIWLSGRHYRS